MGFGRKSERWGELDTALAAYARMAAAARIGCDACLDINYFMAHHRGVDASKAREVPRWREATVFTPVERRVMAYAEAMSLTPPAVTDEQSAELLADLGAAGLLELTAVVGVMNLNARSNVALGIHADGFAESCGLPPLATRPAGPAVASAP
jgi:alkylhydroperoxidase family enzyme